MKKREVASDRDLLMCDCVPAVCRPARSYFTIAWIQSRNIFTRGRFGRFVPGRVYTEVIIALISKNKSYNADDKRYAMKRKMRYSDAKLMAGIK